MQLMLTKMDIEKLHKFDLIKPGCWISGSNRDWAFKTKLLLSLIENEFIIAISSYAMFKPITLDNIDEFLDKQLSKYENCLNSVYSRSFVFSLDSITKLLNVLKYDFNPPKNVLNHISDYNDRFGHLKYIRDSIAHIEDRGRWMTKDKKKIPSNILVLGAFTEDRFEFTASNGKRYNIEISNKTLDSVHKILQAIINGYIWE
jgi:hypothetical protein